MEYRLERFVQAQENTWNTALAEIRRGQKQSHWMWYVFPQIAGLGQSLMSRTYAISGLEEAKAYLAHPLLGSHLREITAALLEQTGTAMQIFGSPDHLKLRSCMTLFGQAAPDESLFRQILNRFFQGAEDPLTIAILMEQAAGRNGR